MKSINRFNALILITCLIINAVAFNIINAQPVDTIQAKLVAKRFFADRLSRSRQMKLKSISSQNLEMFLVHEEKGNLRSPDNLKNSGQTLPLYYIFNVKDRINLKDKKGFIIVSADERVSAILGYSFEGEFSENDQAPAFKAWMNYYKEQIIYAIQNVVTPNLKISDEWKKYSSTIELKSAEQLSEVTPMLTTKWSQRGFYNNLCPYDGDVSCGGNLNHHVPAGCVAVAMAQIMKHYGYPPANNPIPGYVDPLSVYDFASSPLNGISVSYGQIPAVGITTYDWNNMLDDVNIANTVNPPTTAAINAVSTLIYHCGVAVQMDYGPPEKGSGAGSPLNSTIEDAFRYYFKYSPAIHGIIKSDYSDDAWAQLLKTELENGRPVYYSGYANDNYDGGHAFVCDGYQDIDPGSQGRFFHFNWGGGSASIGVYFNLNNLTLGNAPNESVYTYKQCAIVGISHDQASTLTDVDGNQYNTVTIGEQTWMAENLRTTKYNDGVAITYPGTDNTGWLKTTSGTYAWYANDEASNISTYGALYNWYAVNTGKLCPTGWHVATDSDWKQLETYLGMSPTEVDLYSHFYGTQPDVGGKLKEAGTDHWNSPNAGATNESGFTALPGGFRIGDGWFDYIGKYGFWWTSTKNDEYNATAWSPWLSLNESGVNRGITWINDGYSVRCLLGELVETLPGVAGAFVYGYIGTEDEEKWYRFQTGMEGDYAIRTYGSTDTYMYLYNSDQTIIIAQDNDGAESGGNSKIAQSLSANTWYYVKIRGNGNSVTGNYSIGVNALPEAPTANNVTATYDGLLHTAGATVLSGISIVWYDAETGDTRTTQPQGINYGTYAAYAEAVNDATQYTSASRTKVTVTINPAPLSIKANDASKYCGQMNPVFSAIFLGFVNGENESVLGGTLNFSSNANEDRGIGTYSMAPSGLTSDNYAITFIPGILTIKGISIDASASSNPVPVGSSGITLSAKVFNTGLIPVPAVKVWFSVENGNNQFTCYPAVYSDGSGVANLTLNEFGSMVDVLKVTAVAGSGCGDAATSVAYLAVYDPTGGFITGGGWINSPAGAYFADPALTGKANFGFVSKYKKGSNVPDGNTEFQFHEGNLSFNSSSYDLGSLVIGGFKAIYKGAGTINGTGSYRFMVSAVDGDVSGGGGYDKFRIKIWNKTDNSIVYDNSPGRDENDVPLTALGGGSIVIHKADEKTSSLIQTPEFGLNVYPNPFTDHIYFELQLMTDSQVLLEIYDINGSKIATVYDDEVVAYDHYRFEYAPENLDRGILSYRLIVDGQQMYNGKLIHK